MVLMLTNLVSSLANQAYAWEVWTNAPEWNEPLNWEDPTWQEAPVWEDSTWQTPPEWQTRPEWTSPPQWNYTPWMTAPIWNYSLQNPNHINGPGQNPPGNNPNQDVPTNNPSQNNPGNNPSQETPSNNPAHSPTSPTVIPDNPSDPSNNNSPTPPYHPDYQNPVEETVNDLNQTVIQPYKPPNYDEMPFFTTEDPSEYDVGKFAAKDVLGNTVNFADQILRDDSANPADYLKNRRGIFYSGFKTIVKGDPSIDAINDSVDVVSKAKDIYGNAKTYKELQNIKNMQEAGDIIDAATKYDELYKAGKTFSPANAIVSAVTMPFTIKDTYDNVQKLNNAKNSEEKTAAKWDLVGNAGEIVTGLAPAVAMIPGAQPIAAGMVVVGGVLSLASVGHKLYRNRHKIVADVKKKFNKAKDAVTGFFKSVFG